MSQVLSQDGYVLVKTQKARGVYADPGADDANQEYTLTRTSTGGNFTLNPDGLGATANISAAATVTAADIETALEAVVGSGNVDVSGADGGPFNIEFVGDLANQPVSLVVGGSPTGGTVTRSEATAGAAKGIGVRIRGGALGGNRDLMVPDPEIGGNRDVPDAKLGPIRFEGEYQMYGRMEALATFLQAALCNKSDTVSVTDGDGFTTHSLKPGSEQVWLSIEEQIGGGFERFKYTDIVCNTFHLEAAANGYLMMNAGLIGLSQAGLTNGTPEVDQRWDLTPLIVGTNVSVTYGGVTLPAKSFSFDLNNNFENDDFRLGSLYLGSLQPKRREVTMSVTIRPEESSYWRQATWGSASATGPTGLTTKDDVVITIASYEDVEGIVTPGTPYSVSITVPQGIIAPFTLNPNGDDVLQHDMEIRAVRPNPAVDILTAEVVNGLARVA